MIVSVYSTHTRIGLLVLICHVLFFFAVVYSFVVLVPIKQGALGYFNVVHEDNLALKVLLHAFSLYAFRFYSNNADV